MANNGSRSKGKRGLRWKLTMSYTVVTVGALLAVELILLVAASALISTAVINGTVPALIIESVSVDVTPILRAYLAESPADKEGLATWLEQLESTSVSIPLDFDATERLFVVGAEGQLLAARPADLFGILRGQNFWPPPALGLAQRQRLPYKALFTAEISGIGPGYDLDMIRTVPGA